MTTFERFERTIPELMTELAPAQVPDYFDDMLRQTAGTRQRPAWSYPERWLPVDIAVQPLASRRFPWRPLLVVALIGLLIAAGLAVYIGSQQQRLPTPFGPARNGQIVFSSSEGDIVSADPETGEITALISGSELDANPWFSNDGSQFAFDRRTAGGPAALFVANGDGTNLRQIADPAPEIGWFDWSPTGDRISLSRSGDARGLVTILDPADGSTSSFELDMDVVEAVWRPNHDQLVITGATTGVERGYYLVSPDGTGLKPIVVMPTAVNTPAISPDGTKLAYATWGTDGEGRIHVVDIDSRTDMGVDFSPDYTFTDLSPRFSPDGTKLLVERYDAEGYRPTILPIDGSGPVVGMGDAHPELTNGAAVAFSPDGTTVLATYQDDGTTWLFDVATGEAERMTWTIPRSASGSWQRLAP